jgi:alanine racemase
MIHLDDLLRATGCRLASPAHAQHFTDFCYDSRRVEPGQLFLAIKTPKGDGHDHIPEAVAGGATGVLCQSPPHRSTLHPELVEGEAHERLNDHAVTCLVVPDTEAALTDWARFVLRKTGIPVVGITGSVGKTGTREAVAAVLARRFHVFQNPANYSGRLGLPIALGRLTPEHQVAVLEMACDSFDEIAHLAHLTQPQVGIVTAVSHAHLAYLGSLEAIAQEKGRLVKVLPPHSAGGWAILNHDDPWVSHMRERTQAQVVTFGFNPDADLVASQPRPDREGTTMLVHLAGPQGTGYPGYPARDEIRVGLLGRHHAYTALAAIAVGMIYQIPWEEMLAALEGLRPLPGRLNLLPGQNGSLILDDSYSACPASMLAALQTLSDLAKRERPQRSLRRIAVLGDMGQLGSYEGEGHRQVGRAAATHADLLITVGERAERIARAAQEEAQSPAGGVIVTYSPSEAARYLSEALTGDDIVLVKGDVEARLEGVVRVLLANPETDGMRLPRADAVWRQVRVSQPIRPTWLEIDVDAIAHNVRCVKEIVGPDVRLLAVLKADAYGHGAVKVARTALNNGASYCGVASVNEAIQLRQAGVTAPVLVLGYTPAWQAREALRHDVTITLYDRDAARAFSRAAVELHVEARAHIKVDTGMGRLGLLPDEALEFVRDVRGLPGLTLEGIFTHFSVADEADLGYTRQQLERFQWVLAELKAQGITFPLIHAANSAALLRLPESHFTMVRLGLAMYGLAPSPAVPLPPGMRRALTWKTTIAQVKTLPPGSFVSYGNTYQTQREETIAVIPVGYADGFRRAPQHWGEVLVQGRRAPIVGRVCMDQTTINVSHIPDVRVGDEVVLIGYQGDETITAEEVAKHLGTINYEVVSVIMARVPRSLPENGAVGLGEILA